MDSAPGDAVAPDPDRIAIPLPTALTDRLPLFELAWDPDKGIDAFPETSRLPIEAVAAVPDSDGDAPAVNARLPLFEVACDPVSDSATFPDTDKFPRDAVAAVPVSDSEAPAPDVRARLPLFEVA
jgi:hypothetical protein